MSFINSLSPSIKVISSITVLGYLLSFSDTAVQVSYKSERATSRKWFLEWRNQLWPCEFHESLFSQASLDVSDHERTFRLYPSYLATCFHQPSQYGLHSHSASSRFTFGRSSSTSCAWRSAWSSSSPSGTRSKSWLSSPLWTLALPCCRRFTTWDSTRSRRTRRSCSTWRSTVWLDSSLACASPLWPSCRTC